MCAGVRLDRGCVLREDSLLSLSESSSQACWLIGLTVGLHSRQSVHPHPGAGLNGSPGHVPWYSERGSWVGLTCEFLF